MTKTYGITYENSTRTDTSATEDDAMVIVRDVLGASVVVRDTADGLMCYASDADADADEDGTRPWLAIARVSLVVETGADD